VRSGLLKNIALAGRGGRSALAAALFGLGCAGEIWYLDPDILRSSQPVDARRHPAVSPRGLRGCGPASEPLRHRVAPGETLSDLARWYGLPVATLARDDWIAADRWLRIPPGARTGCRPPAAVARAARRPQPRIEASSPAESSLPATRRMLKRAQSSYDAADFEASLELAKSSLHLLESEAENPEAAGLHARAAWIAGLSYTALGHRDPAVASFRAALDHDPSLADQEAMSPKVRFLVESARVASVPTQ
jgi:tetratricopeptide (TPR) repeat protein